MTWSPEEGFPVVPLVTFPLRVVALESADKLAIRPTRNSQFRGRRSWMLKLCLPSGRSALWLEKLDFRQNRRGFIFERLLHAGVVGLGYLAGLVLKI